MSRNPNVIPFPRIPNSEEIPENPVNARLITIDSNESYLDEVSRRDLTELEKHSSFSFSQRGYIDGLFALLPSDMPVREIYLAELLIQNMHHADSPIEDILEFLRKYIIDCLERHDLEVPPCLRRLQLSAWTSTDI